MDVSGANWRKSSRSAGHGGDCVEVAAVWRKSRRSGGNGGDCVEVAAAERRLAVRDSKNPDGPKLGFGRDGWAAFARDVKGDVFDVG